jgi:hypothetical protein
MTSLSQEDLRMEEDLPGREVGVLMADKGGAGRM